MIWILPELAWLRQAITSPSESRRSPVVAGSVGLTNSEALIPFPENTSRSASNGAAATPDGPRVRLPVFAEFRHSIKSVPAIRMKPAEAALAVRERMFWRETDVANTAQGWEADPSAR